MTDKITAGPIATRIAEVVMASGRKKNSTIAGSAEWIERIIRGYYTPTADIQGALNTEEKGAALIEVARNAHRAEQELAALQNAGA